MYVLSLAVELHLPVSHSLKEKRMVVKSILQGAQHRFHVAAAEVGFHEQWQRSQLGFAAVGSTPGHVEDVMDAVDRFVWSRPDIEVLGTERRWME